MICSSLCRVPFMAILLLRFGRTHILDWYSFRGFGQVDKGVLGVEADQSIQRWTLVHYLSVPLTKTRLGHRKSGVVI